MPKALEATPELLRVFDHRMQMAKHRPDVPSLRPCDVARWLNLSGTAVTDRDGELRPANVGRHGKRHRRYSYAAVMAYLKRQEMGGADGD